MRGTSIMRVARDFTNALGLVLLLSLVTPGHAHAVFDYGAVLSLPAEYPTERATINVGEEIELTVAVLSFTGELVPVIDEIFLDIIFNDAGRVLEVSGVRAGEFVTHAPNVVDTSVLGSPLAPGDPLVPGTLAPFPGFEGNLGGVGIATFEGGFLFGAEVIPAFIITMKGVRPGSTRIFFGEGGFLHQGVPSFNPALIPMVDLITVVPEPTVPILWALAFGALLSTRRAASRRSRD